MWLGFWEWADRHHHLHEALALSHDLNLHLICLVIHCLELLVENVPLVLVLQLGLRNHYGRAPVSRRLPAVGTAQMAVGTGCADGHRRHSIVGIVLVGDCPITVDTDWPSA
jgi:hypothetical protein